MPSRFFLRSVFVPNSERKFPGRETGNKIAVCGLYSYIAQVVIVINHRTSLAWALHKGSSSTYLTHENEYSLRRRIRIDLRVNRSFRRKGTQRVRECRLLCLHSQRGFFDLPGSASTVQRSGRRTDPHDVDRAKRGYEAILIDSEVQENSVAIVCHDLGCFRRALPGGGKRGGPVGRHRPNPRPRPETHRRSFPGRWARVDRIDYHPRLPS